MKHRRKSATPNTAASRELRDQEVLRANRELAAYFKGLRTEREARAALKTIKAFVRDRERQDAGSRAPLPGVRPSPASTSGRKRSPLRLRRGPTNAADIAPPATALADGADESD